ncbi:TESMIN/TSO1-LIKE CXC 2, TESMIN/TSO1-like CXC 2 [Hibiscus trionum]|uniref:TESMIN/TSO1-LIKE CXC 2, TESMIN/TSO1-like CXC 2 n=1 Tax=Hibiscus trionum TaxID=183268 RepID=A0A9W7HUM9_HIBTR|nr:TESMIN/TSO1-LIKE CXC 2, TESMIN/TSO1-like CXC 2 [Hibiscus trionum]
MDTPDKTHLTPTSNLSKFEDSPVFKYIDSLSPIELAKSKQTDNVFSSVAFLSPSSLFPSPQISSHRESRFSVKRHHFLSPSNSKAPQSDHESNASEGASKADEHLGCLKNDCSYKGISSDPLNDQPVLATESPRTLKYDCKSLGDSFDPRDEILKNTSVGVAGEERSPFQRNRDGWEKRQLQERDLGKICSVKQIEESAGIDWVAALSDVADMLTMGSSIIHENTDGQDQRTADSGTTSFMSTIMQFPLDNANNLENAESGDPSGSCKQNESAVSVTDRTRGILSTCLLDKLVVSDSGLKKDDKEENCNQSSHQVSIRRRCLVFEKSPGFGLHLNSLPNITKGQSLSKSTLSSMDKGEVPDNKIAVIAENSSETPATFGGNESDHSSPEKKRQKFVEESAACKRCNCKRSKCLKLYCDCFAAGLYCIEPCACQDCFNKPIHENVVLETRRQIESRNPLAFAPKVIRSTDGVSDSLGETNKTPASSRHKRGCNCKRSSCLKKYCECFQAGVGCSLSCRCEGCKNSFGRKDGGYESESDGDNLEACERNASEKNSEIVISKGQEHPHLSVLSPDISRLPFAYRGKLAAFFPHSIKPSLQLCSTQEQGSSDSSSCQPRSDSNLHGIPENETTEIPKHKGLTLVSKPTSPNCKRVSSTPNHPCTSSSLAWRSRKLVLRSIPSFPSLAPP